MASVPAGIFVTISIDYGSSSLTTETAISNTFSLNAGLDSLTAAVEVASKATNAASYFTVTIHHYGGGTAASNALNKAFTAGDAENASYYALCQQGDSQACTKFASSMGQGAAAALSAFHQQVDALSGATNPDLSFLQPFPSGVAGAIIPGVVTSHIPVQQLSDVLLKHKAQLQVYVALVNQLTTLDNRVKLLLDLFKKAPAFNPSSVLDLESLSGPPATDLHGR